MGLDVFGQTGPVPVTISGTISDDVTDRPGRQVGIIYGSRGQLLQTASTGNPAAVELQTGATLYDARQIRLLTAADVVAAVQSGAWAVSLNAGGSIDVTDRAGRLVGVVSVSGTVAATQSGAWSVAQSGAWSVDVTDRAARALGVVASITAAVDVSDRAARLVGRITAPNAGDIADLSTVLDRLDRLVQRSAVYATSVGISQPAANAGATLTLAAPAAGLRHYITSIRIGRSATAALAGTALLSITTTNLNGLAWRVGNAMAAGGTQRDVELAPDYPIAAAVAATATTIVVPVPGAAVAWDIAVTYYVAT